MWRYFGTQQWDADVETQGNKNVHNAKTFTACQLKHSSNHGDWVMEACDWHTCDWKEKERERENINILLLKRHRTSEKAEKSYAQGGRGLSSSNMWHLCLLASAVKGTVCPSPIFIFIALWQGLYLKCEVSCIITCALINLFLQIPVLCLLLASLRRLCKIFPHWWLSSTIMPILYWNNN